MIFFTFFSIWPLEILMMKTARHSITIFTQMFGHLLTCPKIEKKSVLLHVDVSKILQGEC